MINTLTLNPAIDKILYVEEFVRNVTTRIQQVTEVIGGKGTHVSVNLKIMGADNRAFGIAHGNTGAHVIEILEDEGVEVRFLFDPAQKDHPKNTRTNYLLNEEAGGSTLITEKGVEITKQELDDVIEIIRKNTNPGDLLSLSGDASNYKDPYVYNYVMDALKEQEIKFFLDTSGKSLKKGVQAAPFLIKPNIDELSLLCGREVTEEEEDVLEAIHSLKEYDLEVIAVSLGSHGSIVKHGSEIYKATPPKVNVENTVGCGDCYLAGLLYGFDRQMPLDETLRFATATSAAAAECPISVGFDLNRTKELLEQVKIQKI